VAHGSVIAFAPGRVNLIGEHTDYNGGLALPFAIDRGVTVRATSLPGPFIMARARDLRETDTFDLHHPEPAPGWRGFVRGTAAELAWAGNRLRAARLDISGTVPRGAGLSSSAALSGALALSMLGMAGIEPGDPVELARLCSRVENDWVGARTGLLDQLASLLAGEGCALLIDFSTLAVERIELDLGDWTLAVLPSGDRRSHAASGYNDRRRECAEAADRLSVDTLSQADRAAAGELPEPWRSRALHVIDENERVRRAAEALRAGDIEALGPLLDDSHASLRERFAASTEAVERAIDRCRHAGAAGARMMGGGFGGSVLALFAPGVQPPAGATVVRPSAGARLL
jgi:galactokinase